MKVRAKRELVPGRKPCRQARQSETGQLGAAPRGVRPAARLRRLCGRRPQSRGNWTRWERNNVTPRARRWPSRHDQAEPGVRELQRTPQEEQRDQEELKQTALTTNRWSRTASVPGRRKPGHCIGARPGGNTIRRRWFRRSGSCYSPWSSRSRFCPRRQGSSPRRERRTVDQGGCVLSRRLSGLKTGITYGPRAKGAGIMQDHIVGYLGRLLASLTASEKMLEPPPPSA